MTEEMLESLIFASEGGLLDFKRSIPEKIKDDPKAAIGFLKDMIAFGNSSRIHDAHIMIGIAEGETDPDSRVVGIQHLSIEGAKLRDLVTAYIDLPVRFEYFTRTYHGKVIGVVQIPPSKDRFHFLKKTIGYKDGNKEITLEKGFSRIRDGDQNRELTGLDSFRLREEVVAAHVTTVGLQPKLALVSADENDSPISVSKETHRISYDIYPQFAVGPSPSSPPRKVNYPPNTYEIAFRVKNTGTTRAETCRVYFGGAGISLGRQMGALHLERSQLPVDGVYSHNEPSKRPMPGLLFLREIPHLSSSHPHSLYLSFANGPGEYTLSWLAIAENCPVSRDGRLTIVVEG